MKVNVLLALLEQKFNVFKAMVNDYNSFFRKSQGSFVGYKKTYDARPDTMDEPSMRGHVSVVTTVKEKLDWFKDYGTEYLNKKLSIERTNSVGVATADLVVDNTVLANMTSQELLALKTFLENKELLTMYSNIPVRSDSEIWEKTSNEEYAGREVYEQPMMEGVKQSLTKEQYILEDPNLSKLKDSSSYRPQLATKDTRIELGDWTSQKFSGEWTQRKKAELLKRRDVLYTAVLKALKEANEVEAVDSQLNASAVFDYLHDNKI